MDELEALKLKYVAVCEKIYADFTKAIQEIEQNQVNRIKRHAEDSTNKAKNRDFQNAAERPDEMTANISKEHADLVSRARDTLQSELNYAEQSFIISSNSVKEKLDNIHRRMNEKATKLEKLTTQVSKAEAAKETQKLALEDIFNSQRTLSQELQLEIANNAHNFFANGRPVTAQMKVKHIAKLLPPSVEKKKAEKLLKMATEGNIKEVRLLLEKQPELALIPCDFEDRSTEIQFFGMTLLQYAVWILDGPLQQCAIEFLSHENAELQLKALSENNELTNKHGKHFSFDLICSTYAQAIKNTTNEKNNIFSEVLSEGELKKIQRAQRKLPAWVIFEMTRKQKNSTDHTPWLNKNFHQLPSDRDYNGKGAIDWHQQKSSMTVRGDAWSADFSQDLSCFKASVRSIKNDLELFKLLQKQAAPLYYDLFIKTVLCKNSSVEEVRQQPELV